MATEEVVEETEGEEEEKIRIPLYYDRYLEEREKRYASELARLDNSIRHNGENIAELRYDVKSLRTEMNERFGKVDARIDGLRAEMNERFGKMDDRFEVINHQILELHRDLRAYLVWTVGTIIAVGGAIIAVVTFVP